MENLALLLLLCADPVVPTPDAVHNPSIEKPPPLPKVLTIERPPKYRFDNKTDYCWICPDSGRGPKDGIR